MPEIGGEKAKAVQEVAKASKASINLAQSFGAYMRKILGDLPSDAVGYWAGDSLRARRIMKCMDLWKKVEDKAAELGLASFNKIPPKVFFPLLESAVLEDDPDLDVMWANLFVSGINKTRETIKRRHVSALSEFSKEDGLLLRYLYSERQSYPAEYNMPYDSKHPRNFHCEELFNIVGVDEGNIRNLIRLGIVVPTMEEVRVKNDPEQHPWETGEQAFFVSNDFTEIEFTSFGLDFAARLNDGLSNNAVVKKEI